MRKFFILILIYIGLVCSSTTYAQSSVDTLFCGDKLLASYDPAIDPVATDSFYVWIGNCLSRIRFDFTTADVPDAADIFYMDIDGNITSAGSMPYFGGDCTTDNHFTDPVRYPIQTALRPENCLPGFLEIYGQGIPREDSVRQRGSVPPDFKLQGGIYESARLHLDIPDGVVALLFVVKFNPDQTTILEALWDCTPSCCITALGDSACIGENIQLGTAERAVSYRWTGPNGFTSTERAPILENISPADEGWYIIEGEYMFGCTGVDSIYVEVQGSQATLSPDESQICLGGNAELIATGGQSYTWLPNSEGYVSTANNRAIVSPTTTTTYSVAIANEYGCIDTVSATVVPSSFQFEVSAQNPSCIGELNGMIEVEIEGGVAPFEIRQQGESWLNGLQLNNLPAGDYTFEVRDAVGCLAVGNSILEEPDPVEVSGENVCEGEMIQLSTSIASLEYNWTGPNGFQSSEINPSIVNADEAQSGWYVAEGIYSSNCSSKDSIYVDVHTIQATMNTDTSRICLGGSAELVASGGQTYGWISNSSSYSSIDDNSAIVSPTTPTTYSVSVTNEYGCVDTTSAIVIPTSLEFEASSQNPSCIGESNGMIEVEIEGGVAPFEVRQQGANWINGLQLNNLPAGDYTFEVRDAVGCLAVGNKLLEEPEQIEALGANVCEGEMIQLATSIDSLEYNWTGPNGFQSADNAPLINNAIPEQSGWYILEGIYSDQCSSIDSVFITVNLVDIRVFPDTANICVGGETQFRAEGGIAYDWLSSSPGLISTDDAEATVEAVDTNPAIYSVVGTTIAGCKDTVTAVLLGQSLEVEAITKNPSCSGKNDGQVEINVSDGLAPFAVRLDNGSWLSGTSVSDLKAGSFTFEIRDDLGCLAEGQFALEEPAPIDILVGINDPSCIGACDGEIMIIPSGGTAPFSYMANNTKVDAMASDFCQGTYPLEVEDANGCTWNTAFTIEEPSPFAIDLGKDQKIREGKSLTLEIDATASVDSVVWEGICEQNCDTQLLFTPDSSMTITARAWTASGCEATTSVNISVKKRSACGNGLYFPSAFTPNGDGINEFFTLYADREASDVEEIQRLTIFNKWGRMIFDKHQLVPGNDKAGWDGTSKGHLQKEGVYTWVATILNQDNLTYTCSGTVVLLK